jgi:hypothetical protein
MERREKNILVVGCVWMIAVALLGISIMSAVSDEPETKNVDSSSSSPIKMPSKPTIIWMHNCPVHDSNTLDLAISSGVITHVWMLYLHPADAPLAKLDKARRDIAICRKRGVKVIWARTLWPNYEVKYFEKRFMSDPNYYRKFIDTMRTEASILGADFTAVDTEPYASFPFLEVRGKPLSKEEFAAIKNAVEQAIKEKGQLDFLAPSCGYFPFHIYDAVKELGKLKVAEHTYYNIPNKINNPNFPYDIFGAYVNVTAYNKDHPSAPFFTAQEILSRQDLWATKKGLFISANHNNIKKVAEILSEIKQVTPESNSAGNR